MATVDNNFITGAVLGDLVLGAFNTNNIWFTNANTNTTRMRLDSDGGGTFSGFVSASGPKSQIRVNGNSVGCGILLSNTIVGANRRNWGIFTEENVEGDFVIERSTTSGGTPNTPVLSLSRDGAATFNTSASTAVSMISSSTASGLQLNNTGGTNSNWIIQSDGGAVAGQAALRFYSITASAYRMSIDGSGNVGIGTSSPTVRLHVLTSGSAIGTFASESANGGWIRFARSTSTIYGYLGSGIELVTGGGANDFALTAESSNILFATSGGNERMRITGTNGNLLIGTTGEYAFQGGAIIRAKRDTNTGVNIQIDNQSNTANAAAHVIFSTSGNGWVIGMGSQSSSSGNTFYFSPDPTSALNKVATLTTGGVWSTSGGGTSDLRTKEDIDYNFDNGIESILKLQPTKFKFKTAPDKQRRGFIAQDVLDVIPDLVLGDGEKENGTYGLDYDGILALAVKAIQELTQKVNELEIKIK